MKISALVLTKNEQSMIGECLSQLDFVDEIIILDQNSEDKTVEFAKQFTNKIVSSNTEDFAKNRDILASHAKSDWLLYIDADERISKENINEIRQGIKTNQYSAFYFPRKNIILGKWLRHGGWWPDYVPRLFRKNKLKGWYGPVHESPIISGDFGYFKIPIEHLTARNLNLMIAKSNKWAKVEAQLLYKEKRPKVSIASVLKAAIIEFIKRYLAKKGFLDGTVGLIEAIYQSLHQAIILTYLWELQNESLEKFKKVQGE